MGQDNCRAQWKRLKFEARRRYRGDRILCLYTILKLEGGVFYLGHTRELRERRMEHRDGDTKVDCRQEPKACMVWNSSNKR